MFAEVAVTIGQATSNVAEYRARIAGLERVLDLGARHVHTGGDSKLVVCQMRGIWKVKDATRCGLCGQATQPARRFHRVTYTEQLDSTLDNALTELSGSRTAGRAPRCARQRRWSLGGVSVQRL